MSTILSTVHLVNVVIAFAISDISCDKKCSAELYIIEIKDISNFSPVRILLVTFLVRCL